MLLTMLGYPKIKVLHGGFDAWSAGPAGHDRRCRSRRRLRSRSSRVRCDILIDAKTMLAAVANPGIALLDVRDVDEWIGESSSPYGKDYLPAQGPYPRRRLARMVPHDEADVRGLALQVASDEILAECATVGISQNTPVYAVLLQGRTRLQHLPGAGRTPAIKDVRMYFGSWNEWSRDPSLPIEDRAADRRQS